MSIPAASTTAIDHQARSKLDAVALAPLRNPIGGESARKRQKISHACELCELLRMAMEALWGWPRMFLSLTAIG